MLRSLSLSLITLYGTLLSQAVAYEIPQNATYVSRQQEINATRAEFLYGPAVAEGPSYPIGPKGEAKVAADIADVQRETTPNTALIQQDLARAGNSTSQVWPSSIFLVITNDISLDSIKVWTQ
jgi:hypothetical protein